MVATKTKKRWKWKRCPSRGICREHFRLFNPNGVSVGTVWQGENELWYWISIDGRNTELAHEPAGYFVDAKKACAKHAKQYLKDIRP